MQLGVPGRLSCASVHLPIWLTLRLPDKSKVNKQGTGSPKQPPQLRYPAQTPRNFNPPDSSNDETTKISNPTFDTFHTMSVTLHTSLGDIKVEIFCESVPKTAEVAHQASPSYTHKKFTMLTIYKNRTFSPSAHPATTMNRLSTV